MLISLGMVAHTCNSRTQEGEEGDFIMTLSLAHIIQDLKIKITVTVIE